MMRLPNVALPLIALLIVASLVPYAGGGGQDPGPDGSPGGPEAAAANPVTWQAWTSPASSGDYYSVALGDVNRDGRVDIVAGRSDGAAAWLGDGSGGWTPVGSGLPVGVTVTAVVLEDVNQDGLPDAILGDIGSATSVRIRIWTPIGWQSFPSPVPGNGTYSMASGDVNEDGSLDLVVGTVAQGIQVWTFETGLWVQGSGPVSAGPFYAVRLADVNNDGKLDIVASTDGGLRAWTGDGGASWTLAANGLPTGGLFYDVDVADFNRDGDLDVVGARGDGSGLRVWNGNGAGSWTPTFNLPPAGSYLGITASDVNLDAIPDVVATSASPEVWLGDSADGWTQSSSGLPAGGIPRKVAVADLNRDGRVDLAAARSTGVTLSLGQVTRIVNGWDPFPSPSPVGDFTALAVTDLDRDGHLDLVAGRASGGIGMWLGNSLGGWMPYPSPAALGYFEALVPADFNRDGNVDLVAGTPAGIQAWVGDGGGGWTPARGGLPTAGTFVRVFVRDINRDGNMDIVGVGGSANGILYWNGDGSGTWSPNPPIESFGTYMDGAVGDVNGDGWMDLVAASGGLRCWLGGGWTPCDAGLPASGNFTALTLADVNWDGLVDVSASSGTDGVAKVYAGGLTGWSFLSDIVAGEYRSVASADLDLNGSADLVFGGNGTGQGLTGMAGDDNGNWSPLSAGLPTDGGRRKLVLADVDRDGAMDVVSTNVTGGPGGGIEIWIGVEKVIVDPNPPGPPGNLWATLTGSDVTLTWTKSPDDGGGANDVVRYEVRSGTAFDAAGASYVLLGNLPAGSTSYVHLGAGADAAHHYYIVYAVDGASNSAGSQRQAAKFTMPLSAAPQLLSLPLEVQSTAVSDVLATVSHARVWAYSPTTPGDPWRRNDLSKTISDLTDLDNTSGFWVEVTAPSPFTVAGRVPVSTAIPLKTGWNLVAFPSVVDQNVGTALASVPWTRVEAHDAAAGPYFLRELTSSGTISPGMGLWVLVSADSLWDVSGS